MNYYYNPVRLYWDEHCITNLKTCVEELDAKRVLLIKWHENALDNESGRQLYDTVSGCDVKEIVFNKSNPDVKDLYELYCKEKNDVADLIIGIGGGSVLDIAKSLAAVMNNKYDNVEALRKDISDKTTGKPECHWIGVPTTAGTGSEVTCWATVWDSERGAKMSLEDKNNYAYAAYVEPELMMSMPMHLVVSSALDAVAHATESYWAKAHNMVSGVYALKAINLIMSNLDNLIDDPQKKYYVAMSEASMLAGRAFSNTKTTACHSISYPLTLGYHIPHGVAVSMLLPSLLKINSPEIPEMDSLLEAYGADTVEEAGEKIIRLLDKAGISHRLSDWNVKEDELETIAKHCFTKGRMENNPVNLDEKDVVQILRDIY